jgi:hypothetical protein
VSNSNLFRAIRREYGLRLATSPDVALDDAGDGVRCLTIFEDIRFAKDWGHWEIPLATTPMFKARIHSLRIREL